MSLTDFIVSPQNLLFCVQILAYVLVPVAFGWLLKNTREQSKLNQALAKQEVTLALEVKRLDSSDHDLGRRLDSIDTRLDDIAHDVKEILKRGS